MEYLKKLLNRDNFNEFNEMKEFFIDYSKKLKDKNSSKFDYFLKESSLNYETRDKFTDEVNKEIRKVENNFRKYLAIEALDDNLSIKKIFLLANVYTDSSLGFFLKKEKAKYIIEKNPLYKVISDIGQEKYNNYLENDPILLMSIGRFSEDEDWNNKTKNLLKELTINDFETREIELVIIDSNVFKKTSQNIIKKKNFNTHDKILGVHIVSTLNYDIFEGSNAPILRTVTKMFHYHKEIMIFNKCISYIAYNYEDNFSNMLFELLESHIYNENDNLFNTNDVIEGLANKYVDEKIREMAKDYSELKLWASVHDVTHIINDEIVSLSLWRLTSWNISNSNQHSLQMYRDNIVSDMLIKYFSKEELEEGINFSLIDNDNNVFNSIKRIRHIKDFKNLKRIDYKDAIVLHHNDSDGLSSGFIVANTLKDLGVKVYRYSLEIMFPKVMDTILKQYPDVPIFIVDLGTEIIHHLIKKKEDRDIYFIDHHNYKKLDEIPSNYFILNPRKHNINADYEGASSINAFIFSFTQLNSYKYSIHALLGTIGDGMYSRNNNSFKGIDVLASNKVKATELYKDNKLYINNISEYVELKDFVKKELDVIGSVGYYSDGVNLAFELMEQKIKIDDPRIKALKNSKTVKYQRVIEHFKKEGFEEGKYYYSFNVDKLFHPMGIKEIGNFLEYIIKNTDIFSKDLSMDKFYFGAQLVTPVKAIGDVVEEESYKLSMRVGKDLVPLIKKEKYPDLFEICNSFKNIPGGIHSLSAAVIIEKDRYKRVLNDIDKFIDKFLNKADDVKQD